MNKIIHNWIEKGKLVYKKFSFGELVRFALSGFGVTGVHLVSYYFCLLFLNYRNSNLIALVLAKISAFLLNKYWVFRSNSKGKLILGEIIRYILARVVCTGLLDYFGLIFCVEYLGANEKIVKPVLLIFVTVLNFLLGKFFVFATKKS